ncbi:MAG: hypothetical protein ACI8Q1_000561 [Parvicella sp.]|jgi:hypothetical protein
MSEEKEIEKKKKKSSAFKRVISGDVLVDAGVLKNLPFLVFVAFLMLLYVAYGYSADHLIRDLSKEKKRAKELYSESQSLLEVYDMESLQSKVADKVRGGVFEPKDPPRIIEVNKY